MPGKVHQRSTYIHPTKITWKDTQVQSSTKEISTTSMRKNLPPRQSCTVNTLQQQNIFDLRNIPRLSVLRGWGLTILQEKRMRRSYIIEGNHQVQGEEREVTKILLRIIICQGSDLDDINVNFFVMIFLPRVGSIAWSYLWWGL